MNHIYRLLILILLIVPCSKLFATERTDTLSIYVEKIEPYAFISSTGEKVGVFVDYIDFIFEEINTPYTIVMLDSLCVDSIRHYSCCISSQNIWRKLPEDSTSYERMIFHSTGAVLYNAKIQINQLSDVLDYNISVRDKDFLMFSAQEYGLELDDEKIRETNSAIESISELMDGKADFAVDDYLLLNWHFEHNDIKDKSLLEFKSLANVYKLHLSANQPLSLVQQIDSRLQNQSTHAHVNLVFEKWFGHPHYARLQQAESRLHIYLLCLITLMCLLGVGIFVYLKKRKKHVRVLEELTDIMMGFPHAVDVYVDGRATPDYSNIKSTELKEALRKHPDEVYVQEETINFTHGKSEVQIKVTIDVTELEEARQTAERTSMLKTQFLANTSHDLRSPLNSIVGFAALLSECEDEEEMEEYAKIIERNTNDLLRLLDGIIELTLLETSAHLRFKRLPCQLEKLLKQIHQEYKLHLQKEQKSKVELKLVTNFDEMYILSDPTNLHRAICNVVSNACKYTYRGYVEMRVEYDPKYEQLHYIVSDTGVGMSKEKVSSLFSKKDQQDRTKKGSFGFGLMICKAIVDSVDGDIQVTSTEGVGTTVHVTTKPEVLSWSRKT